MTSHSCIMISFYNDCSRQQERKTTHETPAIVEFGGWGEIDNRQWQALRPVARGWKMLGNRSRQRDSQAQSLEEKGGVGRGGSDAQSKAARWEEKAWQERSRCFKETERGQYHQRGIWVTEMRLDKQVRDYAGPWGTGMDMGFYLGF